MQAKVSPAIVSAEIEIDDELITTEEEARAEAIEIAKGIEDWEGKWKDPAFSAKDLDKNTIIVDEVERLDDEEDE